MQNILIISKNKIDKVYFESKIDLKKYITDKYDTFAYKLKNDICYIYFDNIFYEKGTNEYKEFCASFKDIVNKPEEEVWKYIKFPWDNFYEGIDVAYHYDLNILKDLLKPFIDEEYYIITNCGDIIPIYDFILNYNKLD